VEVLGTVIPVTRDLGAPAKDAAVTAGIRPDGLAIAGPDEPGAIPATVEFLEELGSDGYVYALSGDGHRLVVRSPGRNHLAEGDSIGLRIAPAQLHVFDGASGDRL
jgi:ABC-type sugar transport system ATPase subunit